MQVVNYMVGRSGVQQARGLSLSLHASTICVACPRPGTLACYVPNVRHKPNLPIGASPQPGA